MGWITGLLSVIGSGISGFFGLKSQQADVINSAVNVIGDVQRADADYVQASARSIEALYTNGPPIERLWRPILMWIIVIMIVCRWFGLVPPGIEHDEIMRIYDWLEIGLIGYIPLRSLEKIARGFQISSLLKKMIK